ncbi:MAG: adenylyltransferase/cytidyltransferase family protein, partial [Muribaculaceae bacterium]|nr:adenylyltransferase/cytidyltransferase family protein [Muribaculaceae bacterium]
MRIVVYGGSFNPVHAGHAMIASVVAGREDVDEVWMMVSPQNPFKTDMRLMPEQERLRLVKLVADTAEGIKASDFEFRLSRPSYTYKTLCALRDAYPQHTFRLLVGS